MSEGGLWLWLTLLGLGAFHGLNPGMGWLFAVALGLQEQDRRAVWRALLPLALGHLLAIGAVVLIVALAESVIPVRALRWPLATLLLALGIARLFRQRHPRWARMRVGLAGLTLWSFLMASAHGAGLMVAPVFLGLRTAQASLGPPHDGHGATLEASAVPALIATLVHSVAYLLVTALIAVIVFEKLGLGLLRKAWINVDLIWAAALILTGALTLLI